jgi:NodT family efflux transporter outer membrane factor (OMF) lipoprotein
MDFRLSVIVGVFSVFFSGCATVGPDYVPPEKRVPKKFNSSKGEGKNAKSTTPQTEEEGKRPTEKVPIKQVTPEMLADWWNTLDDPLLTQLVERAVKGNLDLKLAQSRLREERARRGIARADRFPTITADGSVTRQKTSKESNIGKESDLFSTGFDASWEVDLFGGIKRSIESAEASLEARNEELNDTLVTLVAEVALNYIEIRSFQARLEAAEKSQKSQEDSLQIVQDRLDSGLTTTLSLEQAKYNLESTKAEIPSLQTGIEQGKNGLAVLLGEFPGSLKKELKEFKKIPITPVEVVVGVPADLLRRRPDVRLRERELAAQTALVGVATADLYPKLTLFGSIGLESLSAASLLTGPAAAFQIGPKVTWNVFNAGRIRQNIKVEDERQEQALIQYESSVLTAVNDVENALIDYAQEQVRRKSLQRSMQSAKRAASLARELYTAGLSDFIGVLDAERALFSFQNQLASSEGQVTSNLIRLFKALGGGWKPLMVNAPQEVPKP